MAGGKFMTADAAVRLVRDGDTVALTGGGGGLLEPSHLLRALERRFLAGEGPRNLTALHALGLGDKKSEGMNRLAHEGLVRRVIGGHWVWSPRMQRLAQEEKIEAYVLPSGCVMQLYREIAAGRPGLFTHVGLGTFVDPRQAGGRMNASAKDRLVEVAEIGGEEYLWYKSFPVHVALIRGSFGDAAGNICLDQEAANLDAHAAALAAHNSGGIVIAQVRTAVDVNSLPARSVRVPGAIVDAVVVDPTQSMSYDLPYDPTISGERRGPLPEEPAEPLTMRQVIARRAHAELVDGAVINYGVGVAEGVARLVARRGEVERHHQTIEHGIYGGALLDGLLFGFARNPAAMVDAPSQFDFYSGGGLDIAFLGFGEVDARGDVNVSKLGGVPVGPGGFIDIAQNARKVVFCGTFDAKGAVVEIVGGGLRIREAGSVRKFVDRVEQITYSAGQALRRGHGAVYVTERAVFELTEEGLVLTEVAPGIDIRRDILGRMAFRPLIHGKPKRMNAAIFAPDFA
jgi:acyl CoA:acetate/3-ketoacid CoA transferase